MLTGSRLRLGALGACTGRLAAGGWRVTCTGEQADSRPAPVRHQTLDGELQEPARCDWRLVARGVGNTKDRDAPALEVRAGTPGVGCAAWDAAGLSSTNRNRVKVARTSLENGP